MAVLVPMSGLRIGRYCSERCTCPVSRVRCVCRPRYAPHDMAMDIRTCAVGRRAVFFGSLSCELFSACVLVCDALTLAITTIDLKAKTLRIYGVPSDRPGVQN